MRFQVPQFIEVEDKIFGPLTGKQFIYIAGAVGVSFVLWTLLPLFLALLLALPIFGLALALSFYKINKRPFIFVLESAVNYFLRNKLYIWKKQEKKPMKKQSAEATEDQTLLRVPKMSQSKLKDLSWSLDIKESMYSDRAQRGIETQAKQYDYKL